MAVCQNLVPLVNIKIAGKWMFIPLKMVLIGIDPYPYIYILILPRRMCYHWIEPNKDLLENCTISELNSNFYISISLGIQESRAVSESRDTSFELGSGKW